MKTPRIIHGDALAVLKTLEAESVHCCITSPPYWGLRDYGVAGQLGLEPAPEEYVARMVDIFREVRRVLRNDGTLWLNLGDSYSSGGLGRRDGGTSGGLGTQGGNKVGTGSPGYYQQRSQIKMPSKQLVGIPWRVAFALQADGYYLRQDIIWAKPNPMPESVKDRCTKSHEYLFLLAKSERYYWDAEAMQEDAISAGQNRGGGHKHSGKGRGVGSVQHLSAIGVTGKKRNRRSVWTVATRPYKGAHFATFPPTLIDPCVRASCPPGGVVLDPFSGAGTTGLVAQQHGREFVGIELNADYIALAEDRLKKDGEQKRAA